MRAVLFSEELVEFIDLYLRSATSRQENRADNIPRPIYRPSKWFPHIYYPLDAFSSDDRYDCDHNQTCLDFPPSSKLK